MTKAIFLGRDDTIVPDRDHLDNVEGLELLDGAGETPRKMKKPALTHLPTTVTAASRGPACSWRPASGSARASHTSG